MTCTYTKGLHCVTQITGSPSTSLKGMVFCPHLTGLENHPTFSAEIHQVPEESATCRTTLSEPPGFTISLSHRTLDAPEAIPLQYFSIKRDSGFWVFVQLLVLKNMPYWLNDNIKHATSLTEYLALRKAPNTHKACSFRCKLGNSRNWFLYLLAKPVALGV